LTTETRGLIDARRLRLMNERAVVVNFARGGLIEEDALYEALAAGRLGGAALDVFEQEPPAGTHRLSALDNVILSPHCSFLTEESLIEMSMRLATGIDAVLSARLTEVS